MKIFLTGATGFVGTALQEELRRENHEVIALGRRIRRGDAATQSVSSLVGDTTCAGIWQEAISDCDVVINLAGESVLQRWNDQNRKRMWYSRVETTRNIVKCLSGNQTLINISATGYYGDCGASLLSESTEAGSGFLADLCAAWEAEAAAAERKGCRLVICRLGVVLGNGGALEKMLPIFRLGMGGRLGSGHQWMPWIHIKDAIRGIRIAALDSSYQGVFNLVAPQPVTNRVFTETLAQTLKTPAIAPLPAMMLSIIFGEASRVMLDSQRAIPVRLIEQGFSFQFSDLQNALQDLVA